MAIKTIKATIQMRRGMEEDFNPDQMTAGEWAVSTDKKYVRMCFMPGLCLRMATYEAFEKDMEEIRAILVEAKDIQSAIEKWNYLAESYAHGGTGKREGEDTDNAKYYSEQAKTSADKAESVANIGIMTTEKAGIGKPDGTTITVDADGTMHSVGGGGAEGDFASKAIYRDNAISLGRVEDSEAGEQSIAFGAELIANQEGAVAIGWKNKSTGYRSVAFGYSNIVSGYNSFSCGAINNVIGNNSASFGVNNISADDYSFLEGCGNASLGYGSHAGGAQNISGAKYVFKITSYDSTERTFAFDDTFYGFADSWGAIILGDKLHIANTDNINGAFIYTIESIETVGSTVHVKESIPISNFQITYATLIKSGVNYPACYTAGRINLVMGRYGYAEGRENIVLGDFGHASGYRTKALYKQHSQGHYNDTSIATAMSSVSGTSSGTAFVIGNGTSSTPSNAARIDYNGKLWCKQAYSSTGADYAELFEWADGNPDNEDRRGYFVTVEGKKIKKAQSGDYILGIISGNPCIIGNTDMEWYGQFMRDEFGSFIKENHKEVIKEPSFDEDGKEIEVDKEVDVEFYKVNPDYNPDVPYTFRLDRAEWDAVGMVGVLPVRDDGTCEVGKFCKCADGGIATLTTERGFDTYMVIERVSENIVSVILK